MPCHLGRRGCVRARLAYRPDGRTLGHEHLSYGGRSLGNKAKADLSAAGQLDIDLGKQLRVEQCPVLDSLRPVDSEPRA